MTATLFPLRGCRAGAAACFFLSNRRSLFGDSNFVSTTRQLGGTDGVFVMSTRQLDGAGGVVLSVLWRSFGVAGLLGWLVLHVLGPS